MSKRDLDFLYEIATLRNVPRGWRQHLGMDCASVLEHIVRVAFLALIIARHEKADENKVLKMALFHDLPEARVSDLSYVQKVYASADEERATADMLSGTSLEDFTGLFGEEQKRETLEAKIVKDADNLDIDLELRELASIGSPLPEKWKHIRKAVRDKKLFTKTAKKIWYYIQNSEVHAWHLSMNKYLTGKDKVI
jgi:putative hydrolase of HD superfamily